MGKRYVLAWLENPQRENCHGLENRGLIRLIHPGTMMDMYREQKLDGFTGAVN